MTSTHQNVFKVSYQPTCHPELEKKKQEQTSAANLAIDNATLASMLADLRADLLTEPDSLSVRFENKLAAIDTKLDGIQSTVNNHEQRICGICAEPTAMSRNTGNLYD